MDIGHFIDLLNQMIQRGSLAITGFVVGVFATLLLYLSPWLWRKLSGRSRAGKEDNSNAELDNLRATIADKESIIAEISSALDDAKSELSHADETTAELRAGNDALAEEITALEHENQQLNSQLEKLTQLDGNVWQRKPIPDQVPRFRPLTHGKPPIVAVVNLKGGVGKTTLTANLGAVASHMGLKPLLVDLDYQNSLSALTLPPQVRADIKDREQVVRKLIQSPEPTGADVLSLMQRIEKTNGFVLATDEHLTSSEMEVMARWITGGTPDDVRYRLRKALHSDDVQSAFDLILIDCPPRITTASVNALACCDYVLVPALLDSLSIEAVPRLLAWLRTFKHDHNVCPHMSVLGVVGNRGRNSSGMSTKQQNIWATLHDGCRDAWGEAVHLFETTIPESVGFADAANDNGFAADSDKLRPIFLDLFSELKQRIPFHAGQESSAVSR